MVVLHLLYAGGTGGIEKLCKDIAFHSPEGQNIFAFVHEGGALCDEMKQSNTKIFELNLKNREVFRFIKALKKIIQHNDPDCIVVHHPAPLIWLGLLWPGIRTKYFVYAHNSFSEIVKNSYLKKSIYSLLLRKSSGVIAISKFVKRTFEEYGNVPADKIHVVYNGIVSSEFCHRDNSAGSSTSISMIYVGRLIREKGIHILLEAFSLLEHKEHIHLTIVGDGEYRNYLEEISGKYNIADQVSFVGNSQNVSSYLQKADIFVHPAIWEEGFGIAIIEAMASGLICVAFKKGAIPEIITDGVNGYIVDECSAGALADKLGEIQKNFSLDFIKKMKEEAVKRAEFFSIDQVITQLNAVYRGEGKS